MFIIYNFCLKIMKTSCKFYEKNTMAPRLYIVELLKNVLINFCAIYGFVSLLISVQSSSLTNGEADVFQVKHQKCLNCLTIVQMYNKQ